MVAQHRFTCAFAHYRSVPLIAAVAVLTCSAAAAHGIAGNRLFPGTLSFDDPAVSDEFALTPSWLNRQAADGTAVADHGVSWELMRLLVPNLAAVVDSGFIHRDWPQLQRNGFETTTLSLKGLLYESDPHEVLLSAKMSWGIGGSGASAVGAIDPNIFQSALYFGKGFGDLPDRFEWLRPFAVTGGLAIEIPAVSRSTILGVNSASSALIPIDHENVPILHWGLSIQYSTYYLTSRFTGGPPKQEPLNQFVPLIEFAFDSPRGQETIANMKPRGSLCGHHLAVRRRSGAAAQRRLGARCRRESAVASISRRPCPVAVWQASVEPGAGCPMRSRWAAFTNNGHRLLLCLPPLLIFGSFAPDDALGKGSNYHTEDRYNPQHMSSLPPDIRNSILHRCNEPKALHPFASYSADSKRIVLHFEHFICDGTVPIVAPQGACIRFGLWCAATICLCGATTRLPAIE
jgi:hypothetical protein